MYTSLINVKYDVDKSTNTENKIKKIKTNKNATKCVNKCYHI